MWCVCVCLICVVYVCVRACVYACVYSVTGEECWPSTVVFWFVICTLCTSSRTARLGALSHYHYRYFNCICDLYEQHFTHMRPSCLTGH